jgi:hypothetical protein
MKTRGVHPEIQAVASRHFPNVFLPFHQIFIPKSSAQFGKWAIHKFNDNHLMKLSKGISNQYQDSE